MRLGHGDGDEELRVRGARAARHAVALLTHAGVVKVVVRDDQRAPSVVLLAAAVFVHVLRLRFAQKEPLHRDERLDARSLPRRGVETRRRTAGVVSAGRARLAFFGGESTLDVVEGHERDADAVRLGAGRDRARERGLAGAGKTAHRQQARARDITIRLHRRRRAHLVLMRDKASISSEVTPLQLSGAASAHSQVLLHVRSRCANNSNAPSRPYRSALPPRAHLARDGRWRP